MPEFTQEHEKMITETRDIVRDIQIGLKGFNGEGGLLNEMRGLATRQNTLEEKHNELRVNYSKLVGILIGSGILTGGAVAGLTKLIGG